MKRSIAILLAGIITFALTACGGGSSDGDNTQPATPATPATQPLTTPLTTPPPTPTTTTTPPPPPPTPPTPPTPPPTPPTPPTTPIEETQSPFSKVQEVYDGDTVSVGTYIGNGINYYDVNMPEKGNLVLDKEGVSGIYLYDKNLNLIGHYYVSTVVDLDAGNYIVKFDHYDSKYTFTLNSNVW